MSGKEEEISDDCVNPKLYIAAIVILLLAILFTVYYIFYHKKDSSLNEFGIGENIGEGFESSYLKNSTTVDYDSMIGGNGFGIGGNGFGWGSRVPDKEKFFRRRY